MPDDLRWEGETAAEPRRGRGARPRGRPRRSLNQKAAIEAELFKGKRETVIIELDGKRLRLSHLNKVYFPEPGFTKRDLLAYYYRMAEVHSALPRKSPAGAAPLSRRRAGSGLLPEGLTEGLPDWFQTIPIHSEGKREMVHYAIANDLASLLFLTNLGCIDHNPWSSRTDDLEHPDYFFFDLDPSEGTHIRHGSGNRPRSLPETRQARSQLSS